MENSLNSHSSPGVQQLELILYDIHTSKGDPPKDKRWWTFESVYKQKDFDSLYRTLMKSGLKTITITMFNKVLIIFFTRFNYQRCGKSQTDRGFRYLGKNLPFS